MAAIFLNKKRKMRDVLIFLAFFGFSFFHSSANFGTNPSSLRVQQQESEKKYNLTTDWFTYNIPVWEKILSPYKGMPHLQYLEIGVFEGRSTIWMLENVLTNCTSRLTCIDFFPGDLKERFLANLAMSGFADKVVTIKGLSHIELRKLPINSFDIIYIDASHAAENVLTDSVLSWLLLKEDGIIIFDDYLLDQHLPGELRPKASIDSFITAFRNYFEVIHHGYQVILKKRKPDLSFNGTFVFPIGECEYFWRERKLQHSVSKKLIELSEKERDAIERLIKSRKYGQTTFSPGRELLSSGEFLKLQEKLGLKLDFKDK